jgi:transposase
MGKIERSEVPAADRERLEALVRDRKTPQKVVWRAQIVLLTGEGLRATEVAARVGPSTLTVRRWRRRYAQAGVEGLLKDAPRPPGRKPLTAAVIQRVVAMTKRHRPQAFLRFLRVIHRNPDKRLDLHLIVDHYATHKHPRVKAWLERHPRFHRPFTPTSASWLNLVERFFALITQERIRRGTFSSVPALESAIMDSLEHHNADPRPFVWTAPASAILEKVARAKQALESQH